MLIEVEFDSWCQVGFYIFARWPFELMDLIGAEKQQMFQDASPDPDLDIRTGQRGFDVAGRRFVVDYAVGEPYQAESGERIERLRVLRIDEA